MRAQMRAKMRARKWRGNEKKMRFLDTDTKFMKIRFLKLYTSSLKRNTSKTSNFARKRNHQYSTKRVKLNGKVLNPHIVYNFLEPDFVIYSLLERKVAFDVFFRSQKRKKKAQKKKKKNDAFA